MQKFTLLVLLFSSFIFAQKMEGVLFNGNIVSLETVLQRYIQVPSVSDNEKEAGDFFKAVCKENGLYITDFGSENGNYNFAASIFPLAEGKPNIIFLNHIDVVPEKNTSEFNAYSGKIIDGEIYGRGAIDNKGVAVMHLYGILKFLENSNLEKAAYNVTLLSVSCEETQCEGGAKYVVDNYLDVLNPVTVIGEGPSEISMLMGRTFKNMIFGISVVHKRIFWLDLELEIETNGHGSITPLEYANKEMVAALNNLLKKKNRIVFNEMNVNFIKGIGKHEKGLMKTALKHPRFFSAALAPRLKKQPEIFALFSNTITLTNIYTDNDSFNKIPSKIGAYLDCRLLPSTDQDEFLAEIKKRLKNDNIKIKVVKIAPESHTSITENIYYTSLEEAIIEKYENAEVMPILLPTINDLGVFRAKGIPCYASMPIRLPREQAESVHNKNEHISISLLYDGADVYSNFLISLSKKTSITSLHSF